MIALKPFSRKVGGAMAKVMEGKSVPKSVLDSYTSEELKELKDKKIIADDPVKKSYKESK